jgi:hypothetical protein
MLRRDDPKRRSRPATLPAFRAGHYAGASGVEDVFGGSVVRLPALRNAAGLRASMKAYVRLGEGVASTLLLLAPALWNGFPFLQYDSGGYLARWFEGYLVPSRSTVYGLFAVAGWPLDFWPVVAVQAAVAVWIVALMLRVYGFGERRFALLGTVAVLAVTTSLPWIAGILLTDIFAGSAVLAVHLLIFAGDAVSRRERMGLFGLVAFATASHSATLAVLTGIVGAASLLWLWRRDDVSMVGLRRAAAAIVAGAAMLLSANFGLSGQFQWTPGGYGIVFARLVQDGIAARYLEDHCPNPKLKLCPYRHELPATADQFLWTDGPFTKLGRFAGLGEEMRTIVLESLIDYPRDHIETAAADAAKQLVLVASGEGVVNSIWHTYYIIERYMPSLVPAMRAARQQHGEVSFAAINRLHLPMALLSLLLLPVIVVTTRRGDFADLRLLAATVAVAILVNAAVCGALSNPHNRYGARLAWIATFAVGLVPARVLATRTWRTLASAQA